MRKRILLCVAILGVLFMVACGNNKSEETKEAEEKAPIRVGTTGTFAPTIYKDENGELTGFEYEVMEEIGKRCNRKIEWTTMDAQDNLFGALDAGKLDTIAFQISINDKRKATYDFTEVYGHNKIYLCVREDFKYDSLDDLQGKKVCLNPAHAMYPVIEKYNEELPDDKKIEIVTGGSEPKHESLEMERFDAFPTTPVALKNTLAKKPYKVKIGGEALVVEDNAFPFSKEADPELFEDVNNAVKEMLKDGTLKELSMKYYDRDVTKAD